MLDKKLKVLIVDDTIVYRKAVGDVLAELPDIEVVGVAHNGKIAMAKIKSLKPDLLTLDIEMPEMNGIEVLEQIRKEHLQVGAIVISTLTTEGGALTMKALELGAFDFILKPKTSNIDISKQHLRQSLFPLLQEYRKKEGKGGKVCNHPESPSKTVPVPAAVPRPSFYAFKRKQTSSPGLVFKKETVPSGAARGKSDIIAIGISTGGPNALNQMLPLLPKDIGVPILIVQHMPPLFTKSLADSLNKKCDLTIKEAEDGEAIRSNVVYIAPGGKQMRLIASANGVDRLIKITDDPPENSCKPSVDYLFRSVADYYFGRTTAVIMTGMGSDGTKGLQVLKNKGAYIIAQDQASCVVYGMPKAPIEMGLTDVVAPLANIADEIVKSIR